MSIRHFVVANFFVITLSSSFLVQANQFLEVETLSDSEKPASLLSTNKTSLATHIIANKPDLEAIAKNDQTRALTGQPYRFSLPVSSVNDFTEQGVWTNIGDTAVWRLKVAGKHVKSFNIGLKDVFLPQQARLFFYSDDYKILVGPFTDQDNKSHRELWSPVIESNNVTIEVNVPRSLKHLTQFKVTSISQGYRGIRTSDIAKSGSCNNDVVCSEADAWRNEIRSVARYIITANGSSFFCTGTLMNNVSQDLAPYFLTAGHCEVDATTAPSIVTYWNYETSVCQGTPDGQLNQFQTGTTFRAGTAPTGVVDSDFAIVQLDTIPNSSFNVYWSGWDNSAVAPNSAVGIHHPSGDEKRISFDNDPLSVTDYGSTMNTTGTHLMVNAWDDGTTEGGSSGSGLWNSNHHLVGTLSGGSASCQNQNAPDWYGRFSTHWIGNGNVDGQVKAWLDPDDTGAVSLDGRNACDPPQVTINSSPATANIGDNLNFTASATGGSGSYTYTWDVNGDYQDDLTSATPPYSYDYFYQGNIRVTATDSAGCPGYATAAIVVSHTGDELFLANGEIPAGWSISGGADAGWSVENTGAFEGTYMLGSNDINDDQTSSIEVTETFQGIDNFIAFAYKVSSETGYDKLIFTVDDVVKGSWSGEIDWGTAYIELDAGSHTLKWSYVKDASVSTGQDKAWIDGVTGIDFGVANSAPNAAVSQSILNVTEGANVTLDASSSTDPENDDLTFEWSQVSGTSVALNNSTTAVATFATPSINVDETLEFEVTVTDTSGNSDTASITVNISEENNNQAPTAALMQRNINAEENTSVTLDASNSSDPNNDALTFAWAQTAGPAVTLSNASSATASFTAPNVNSTTTLRFTVTVTDPSGASDADEVVVSVTNIVQVDPPSGGGGGSMSFLFLVLLWLIKRPVSSWKYK